MDYTIVSAGLVNGDVIIGRTDKGYKKMESFGFIITDVLAVIPGARPGQLMMIDYGMGLIKNKPQISSKHCTYVEEVTEKAAITYNNLFNKVKVANPGTVLPLKK